MIGAKRVAGAARWKLNGTGFHGTTKLTMPGTSSMFLGGLTYPAEEDRPALICHASDAMNRRNAFAPAGTVTMLASVLWDLATINSTYVPRVSTQRPRTAAPTRDSGSALMLSVRELHRGAPQLSRRHGPLDQESIDA